MTTTAPINQYRDLLARLEAAQAAVVEAEHFGRTQPERTADCICDLAAYERAVAFAQRVRDTSEERLLALRIAEAIAAGDAVLRAVDPHAPARGFVILDPTVEHRQVEARAALARAQAALSNFGAKHRPGSAVIGHSRAVSGPQSP